MICQSTVRKHSDMTKLNEVVDILMESANDSSRLKKDYSHLFKSVYDVRPKNKYRWFGTSLRCTDSKAFSKTHLIDLIKTIWWRSSNSSNHSYSLLLLTWPIQAFILTLSRVSFLFRLISCGSEEGAKEFLVDESHQTRILLFLYYALVGKGYSIVSVCSFASSVENEDEQRAGILLYLWDPAVSMAFWFRYNWF